MDFKALRPLLVKTEVYSRNYESLDARHQWYGPALNNYTKLIKTSLEFIFKKWIDLVTYFR